MSFKDFTTTRLQMKRVQRQLASKVYPILNDTRLYTYLPDDPLSLEAMEKRFTFWEPGISPDQSEYWLNWVIQIQESQQVIGTLQAGVNEKQRYKYRLYVSL